jgi:hypothetical protein
MDIFLQSPFPIDATYSLLASITTVGGEFSQDKNITTRQMKITNNRPIVENTPKTKYGEMFKSYSLTGWRV